MHDEVKISKHAADVDRRPTWSERGPHIIGASGLNQSITARLEDIGTYQHLGGPCTS